jgi:hypothetical protein
MKFKCSECGAEIIVPDGYSGSEYKCQWCGGDHRLASSAVPVLAPGASAVVSPPNPGTPAPVPSALDLGTLLLLPEEPTTQSGREYVLQKSDQLVQEPATHSEPVWNSPSGNAGGFDFNASQRFEVEAAKAPWETEEENLPIERDQIVALGRSRSGKTIFLASIYAKLWKSLNGMTAKAISGETHKQLILVDQMLKQGKWPPATLGTSQVAMEIEYRGKKRLFVALDFGGELFSRAFVGEESDFPGVKQLLHHIDRAGAVMLLVDPSVIAGKDVEAAADDDFGIVQAVQRIRNWPGGEEVPIVLVLTKMDLYQQLVDQAGGVKEFVRQHFPALVRLLKEIPIFQVSAVQVKREPDGRLTPRPNSTLINIDHPLRYCLSRIHHAEQDLEQEEMAAAKRQQELRLIEQEERLERRHNRFWTSVVIAILLFGAALIALIIITRF